MKQKMKQKKKKMFTKQPCIDDFLRWWFGDPLYKVLKKIEGIEEL